MDNTYTVRDIKEYSGLNDRQIAGIFGVSQRTVYHWGKGERLSERHQDRLTEISEVVFSVPGDSPEERRAALLSSEDNPSILLKLLGSAPRNHIIRHRSYPPSYLIHP